MHSPSATTLDTTFCKQKTRRDTSPHPTGSPCHADAVCLHLGYRCCRLPRAYRYCGFSATPPTACKPPPTPLRVGHLSTRTLHLVYKLDAAYGFALRRCRRTAAYRTPAERTRTVQTSASAVQNNSHSCLAHRRDTTTLHRSAICTLPSRCAGWMVHLGLLRHHPFLAADIAPFLPATWRGTNAPDHRYRLAAAPAHHSPLRTFSPCLVPDGLGRERTQPPPDGLAVTMHRDRTHYLPVSYEPFSGLRRCLLRGHSVWFTIAPRDSAFAAPVLVTCVQVSLRPNGSVSRRSSGS